MSSVNRCLLSVELTEKIKPQGESIRRLAVYKFWDGRIKGLSTAMVTLIGWGENGGLLKNFPEGELVVEGRLGMADIENSKDKRLEFTVAKFHL